MTSIPIDSRFGGTLRIHFLAILLTAALAQVGTATAVQGARSHLFPFEENGRWGFLDELGRVAIPPRFQGADEFVDGRAIVLVGEGENERRGFVDETGKLVIEPTYTWVWPYSEGLAKVQVDGDVMSGRCGFIDKAGKMVIPPTFQRLRSAGEEMERFHAGFAVIEVDYKMGYIDSAGNVVIPPRFAWAHEFTEGLAAATTDYLHDKWGYINRSGEWAIPPEFDSASPFSEGLARVSRDGMCVYIDRNGTEVLRPDSGGATDCAVVAGDFSDGLARWKVDDQYGYIDKKGGLVISPAFDLTFGFSEGLAAVEIDGLWGYVDAAGRVAIPPRFARAEPFHNGLAEVGLFGGPGRHWGYVNRAGDLIYDSAKSHGDPPSNEWVGFQRGHTNDLLFAGWSPDGKLICSYSAGDGWIRLWEVASGRLSWAIEGSSLRQTKPLRSPDGRWVATGVPDSSYQIRDAGTGALVWDIAAHGLSPEKVPSPDGQFIAERGSYGEANVKITEAKSGRLVRVLEGHPGIVASIAFSTDGRLVASANGDRTVALWDAATGELTRRMIGHRNAVSCVAFSPDGNTIVSGDEDGTVIVWDKSQSVSRLHLEGHDSNVNGLAVSPDGLLLASASRGSIKFWDLRSGALLKSVVTPLVRTESGDLVSEGPADVTWLAFSGDGQALVAGTNGGLARVILKSWEVEWALGAKLGGERALAGSRDGSAFATCSANESSIEIGGLGAASARVKLPTKAGFGATVAFSRDGERVATGGITDEVHVWESRTGRPLKTLSEVGWTKAIAFSPDGTRLAAGGDDQTVRLWDLRSGMLLWDLAKPAQETAGLSECPVELTEAGRSTTFRYQWLFLLETDKRGAVRSLSQLMPKSDLGLVNEAVLRKGVSTWILEPNSKYSVAFSIGTTGGPNSVSITNRASGKSDRATLR